MSQGDQLKQDNIKDSNLRKKVGITMKNKETSSQPCIAIMQLLAQPCSQMHVQNKAFSSTSTRFHLYFGWHRT